MSTYENLGVNGAIVVLESLLDRYEKKHIDGMTVQDVRDHFKTMKDDVRVALAFCKAEKKNKEGEAGK
jgi:hypothetical protein